MSNLGIPLLSRIVAAAGISKLKALNPKLGPPIPEPSPCPDQNIDSSA